MEKNQQSYWNRWTAADWLITALISGAVFTLLRTWSYPTLYPDSSSRLIIEQLGLLPNPSPRGVVWTLLVKAAAAAGDISGTVSRIHFLGQICAAAAAGILYRATFEMLLGMVFSDATSRRMGVFLRLTSAAGAVMLIVCEPVWRAAQSPHPAVFGVLMLTLSMLFTTLYASSKKLTMLIAFAAVSAIGCVESPAAALALPIWIMFLYMVTNNGSPEDDESDGTMRNLSFGSEFRGREFSTKATWTTFIAVFIAISGLMITWNTWQFESTHGAAVRYADRFLAGFAIFLGDYFAEIRQFLPGGGWMLVFFGLIVPAVVTVIVSPYIFTSIRCFWHIIMYATIGVISVAQALPVNTGSLWIYLATPNLQVWACCLSTFSFVFVIAFFLVTAEDQFRRYFSEGKATSMGNVLLDGSGTWDKFCLFANGLLSIIAAVLFLAGTIRGGIMIRHEEDNAALKIIGEYVRELAQSAEGRRWIISDRTFDDLLRMDAYQRGLTIDPLPYFPPQNNYERRAVTLRLPDDDGSQSFYDIGTDALINDWSVNAPGRIGITAALTAPPAWDDTGYRLVPNGLLMIPVEKDAPVDIEAMMNTNRAVWLKWKGKASAAVTENELLKFLLRSIDRQIAVVANECGVLCENAGDLAAAREAYGAARFFDNLNLSARCNLAGLNSNGIEIPDIAEVRAEIKKLSETFGTLPLPVLMKVQGRITDGRIKDTVAIGEAIRTKSSNADAAIRSALEKIPENTPEERRARAMLASTLLMRKDYDGAQREYAAILAEDEKNISAMFGMATIAAHTTGNPSAADPWLEVMKANDVDEKTAAVFSAVLCRECGDPEKLRRVIAPYITEKDATQDIWLLWGWAAVKLGDAEEKSRAYAHLKTQTSVSQLALYEAQHDNNWRDMVDKYLEILKRNPDNSAVQKSTLDVLLADGRMREAYDVARSILKDDYRYAPAHFAIGTYQLQRKKTNRAILHLLRAREFGKDTPPLLNNLGMAYLYEENYANAREFTRMALELQPDSTAILDTAAEIEMAESRFSAAEGFLKKALEKEPENLTLLLRYGVLEKERSGNGRGMYEQLMPRAGEMSNQQKRLWKSLR